MILTPGHGNYDSPNDISDLSIHSGFVTASDLPAMRVRKARRAGAKQSLVLQQDCRVAPLLAMTPNARARNYSNVLKSY